MSGASGLVWVGSDTYTVCWPHTRSTRTGTGHGSAVTAAQSVIR